MADEFAVAVRAAEERKRLAEEEASMAHEGGVDMPPPTTPAQAAYDAARAAKGDEAENLKKYGTKEKPADLGGPKEEQKSFGTIQYPSYPQDATGERVPTEVAPEETPQAPRSPAGPVMVPGGWQPSERAEQRKLGKPVPEEAQQGYRTATGLELGAAAVEHDAKKELYAHERDMAEAKLAANKDAMVRQERLGAERDQFAKDKLAQIADLNRQAQGSPEDLWSTPQALASVIGAVLPFLAVFAGGGLAGGLAGIGMRNMINSNINKDIEAKIEARKAAGHRADREKTLYDLHMDNFNDQAKAIDATKLAYYDNVLQMMAAHKADHLSQMSDAQFAQATSGIMKDRADTENRIFLQGQDDVTLHGSERYRPAQMLGGAGVSADAATNVVRYVDGEGKLVSVKMPNKEIFDIATKKIEAYNQVQAWNNDIMQLRKQAGELNPATDLAEYKAAIMQIENLEHDKLRGMETMRQQGILHEGEVPWAQQSAGFATTGLTGVTTGFGLLKGNPYAKAEYAAANKALDGQQKRLEEERRRMISSMGSNIVVEGYAQGPQGLTPGAIYQGENPEPPMNFAPSSFRKGGAPRFSPKPLDVRETQVWPGQPASLSAPTKRRRHR